MKVTRDNSRNVILWEASYPGATYRLRVCLGEAPDGPSQDDVLLTLKGARHLRKRLDRAIARLEKETVKKRVRE